MTRFAFRSSVSTLAHRGWLRRHRREESGASLVEFALILPIFALMLFGMIQFGLGFLGWDQLRDAVQTGARLAANNDVNGNPSCGQTDPGSNMVCQVSLLIGAPVDSGPTVVNSDVPILGSYGCNSSLTSCTGGYAWLDGYYIFDGGQWLQIVSGSPTNQSSQKNDSEAFIAGSATWTCAGTSGSICTSMTNSAAGQNQGSLGSDNIAISVQSSLVQICAQRQVISFTALPGLQGIHISTTSTFYVQSPPVLGCPTGPPCTYASQIDDTCG
jgi:Flp pilus assembly pilin Flp